MNRKGLFTSLSVILIAVLTLMAGLSEGQDGLAVGGLIEELASYIHGPARWYIGTPELCASSTAKLHPSVQDFEITADGGCRFKLSPNTRLFNSPAQAGLLEHITDDPVTRAKVLSLLDELRVRLKHSRLTPLQKLGVQIVVWDLYGGLVHRRTSAPPDLWVHIDYLISSTRQTLGLVLLSREDCALLPDAFGQIINPSYKLSGKVYPIDISEHAEVLNPSILHTMATRGRLVTKVIIGIKGVSYPTLREILDSFADVEREFSSAHDPGVVPRRRISEGHESVANLPQVHSDIHAVLVLLVTALDSDWQPRPTPVVALWHEYQVAGKVALPSKVSAGMVSSMTFRSIELERWEAVPDPKLVYVEVPGDRPEPIGLLPRNNTYDDGLATTHNDNCRRCHSTHVATFNDRLLNRFKFSRPSRDTVPLTVEEFWMNLKVLEGR